MKTNVYWSWDVPEKLAGIAVIIDVYAASSNIAAFLSRGVDKLYLSSDATILELKKQYPSGIAIGESRTLPKDTFVSNNYPGNVSEVDVSGKTVLYMSNNGTRVIQEVLSKGARTVITAGFVNMDATVSWLIWQKVSHVTFITAGEISVSDKKVLEDDVCAKIMVERLAGRKFDIIAKIKDIEIFMKAVYKGTKEDRRNIDFTMTVNSFPVVPLCTRIREGLIEVTQATSPDV